MGGDMKGTTTTKETERKYPAWIGEAQEQGGEWAMGQNEGFASFYPAFMAAGFTPDQIGGFDALRKTAGQYGGSGGVPSAQSMIGGMNVTSPNAAAMMASPAKAQAAQLGGNDYQQFMSPYLNSVLDPAIGRLNRQRDETNAEIGARGAAAGTFGGSREALQRGQLDRSTGETIAELTANTMAQGYDTANQLASQNVDRAQQTSLQNAGFEQQAGLQNAQLGTQVGMSNANNSLQAMLANAGNQLQAFGLNSNLQDADLTRQLAAIAALMGGGAQQQALAQTSLDTPYTALQRFMSVIPQVYDFTEKTKQKQSGGGGLGSILGLAKLIPGLSDENEKTNKQLLGKDPMTGLPIYAYDYKSDVEKAKGDGSPMGPKRVGPMAGDIQKIAPGLVNEIGGKKTVGSPLAMLLGN